MATQSSSPPDAQQRLSTSRRLSSRLGLAFKRVGQYLNDQAEQQSHSGLHLSPATKEPQRYFSIWSQSRNHSQDNVLGYQLAQKYEVLNGYLPIQAHGISRPVPSSQTSTMATNSTSGPGVFQDMIRHQYASDHILQSIDVLEPGRDTNDGYWIVYIHGGYFRDTKVDSASFKPTISLIEESQSYSSTRNRISGYASINYRLSPHPAYPQDPAKTPSYTLNNAKWPDQPNDVIAALRCLQRTHARSKKYILVGHSVGAALAFLAVLQCKEAGLAPPEAVVGVSGIYDFPAIHMSNPDYEGMTRNGMDERYYKDASPALHPAEEYVQKWKVDAHRLRLVLVGHSKDDGLVPWSQPEEMLNVFTGNEFKKELIEIHGQHNEIWEKGNELVRVVEKVMGMIA